MGPEISLAQLRILAAFEDEASVSAVARAFQLSQPTVSQMIKGLEARLDTQLLLRSPSGSTLSDTGRAIIECGRPLLREALRFDERVAELILEQAGPLRIAASLTIAEYLMPTWLSRLAASGVPRHEVELQVHNSKQVLELLRSQKIHVGFIEGTRNLPGMSTQMIGSDQLVFVATRSHPLTATQIAISLHTLLGSQLLLREPGSGTREVFEQALRKSGVQFPRAAATMGSTAAIKAAVRAGDGIAVISRTAVRTELGSGEFVEIEVPELEMERSFRMVSSSHSQSDRRLSLLLRIAREHAESAATAL